MKDMFSIGEMSKLFCIDVRLLRHYHDIGLFVPAHIDSQNGYRYYSISQFEQLNTILYFRSINMPLMKIKLFLSDRKSDKLLELFAEQKNHIEQEQKRLALMLKKVDARITQIEDALHTQFEQIQTIVYPKRYIRAIRSELSTSDNIEYPIRELASNAYLNSEVFLGKVGIRISKEDMIQQQFSTLSSIFILLEQENSLEDDYLKEGKYLVYRFQGIHKDAKKHYEKLMLHMQEHQLSIKGDAVEFALIDGGITEDTSLYTTEIQIPYQ